MCARVRVQSAWWEGGLYSRQTYLCKNMRVKEGRGLIIEGGLFSGGYGNDLSLKKW